MSLATVSALLACVAYISADTVSLEDFSKTMRKWEDTNDPVMGGRSSSSFMVANGSGIFNGTARIVPSLQAPGFCKTTGVSRGMDLSNYASLGSLEMLVRSTTPEYTGFKVGFGGRGVPKTSIFGGGSYKTEFNVTGMDWQTISLPMHRFSYDWSGFTGRCDTLDPKNNFGKRQQHYCCDRAPMKSEVCPNAKYLKDIEFVALWAEGVAGDFHLEVKTIKVTDGN
jgi:hypothetical protein